MEGKKNTDMEEWLKALASDAPAPGGGGASALAGSCAAALGAMVANLTRGNKRYEDVRPEMTDLAERTEKISEHLFNLIEEDRLAFLPLAEAYRIPKDEPGRAEKLEAALRTAAGAPMDMLRTLSEIPPLLSVLFEKGSRLALSDVGCAAALCRGAAESAHLNILVNTGLMKDRGRADELEGEADRLLTDTVNACDYLYASVRDRLSGTK